MNLFSTSSSRTGLISLQWRKKWLKFCRFAVKALRLANSLQCQVSFHSYLSLPLLFSLIQRCWRVKSLRNWNPVNFSLLHSFLQWILIFMDVFFSLFLLLCFSVFSSLVKSCAAEVERRRGGTRSAMPLFFLLIILISTFFDFTAPKKRLFGVQALARAAVDTSTKEACRRRRRKKRSELYFLLAVLQKQVRYQANSISCQQSL